jgi:hypothetical protein
MEDRIRDIMQKLEEAIDVQDFNMVEEARNELLFLVEEMGYDFPSYDDY